MHSLNQVGYTPLEVPDAPESDTTELLAWLKDTHEKHRAIRTAISTRGFSYEQKIKKYPWHLTPLYFSMPGLGVGGWTNHFDSRFPELAEHISGSYGFNIDDLGSVVALPVKSNFSGWGFWHSDPDISGLRLYLHMQHSHENALYVRRKGEQGSGMACKIKSKRQSFFLNNNDYEHAIYVPDEDKDKIRIAVLIIPKLEQEVQFYKSIQPLILASSAKYKDNYACIF